MNGDFKENYLKFFEILGINTKRLVRIEKPTKYKKIYVPEDSYSMQEYYSEEYCSIFEKIKNNIKEDEKYPKKIFLSRKNLGVELTGSYGRCIFNLLRNC